LPDVAVEDERVESRTIALERAEAPPGVTQRPWTAQTLHAGFYSEIYAFFTRRVRPVEDAEDLTASTLLAAYENLGKMRGVDPRLFLYGIARRKLADALRRRRTTTTLDDLQPATEVHDSSDTSRALKLAVRALPESQAEALMLHGLEGMGTREIATVMKRSEKSVKALLQRARESLRSNSLLQSIAEEIHV
jgi:RNA polymerase sigma-70 factor, ECF subfamily